MALAYELWGELKVENASFKRELKESERALEKTKSKMDSAERSADKLSNAQNRTSHSSLNMNSALKGLAVGGLALAGVGLAKGINHMVSYSLQLNGLRNRMLAVTGSSKAMGDAWKEINAISNKSVGVTREFARETFIQLKGLDASTQAIYNLIPALGKLNAAFEIPDMSGFVQNLNQIFQQGFERADIKEAIGRVPIFEELLKGAFGTSDGDKLRQLKDAGKLTMEGFLSGLAESIEGNAKVGKIQESLTVQLAKTSERLSEAFEPAATALLTPILKRVGELGTEVAAKIEASNGDFTAAGTAIGEAIGKGLGEATTGIVTSFFASFRSNWETDQAQFNADVASKGWGTAIIDNFFRQMSSAISTAAPGLQSTLAGFVEGMFGVKLEIPSVAAINRTGAAWVAAMGGWANVALAAVSSPFSGLSATFAGFGAQIIRGFVNGIKSEFGSLDAILGQMVAKVVAVRSSWWIFSPSKLFHYYGEMLIKGLTNGIEAGFGALGNTLDAMIGLVISKMEKAPILKTVDKIKALRDVLREYGVTAETYVNPLTRINELLSDKGVAKALGDRVQQIRELAAAILTYHKTIIPVLDLTGGGDDGGTGAGPGVGNDPMAGIAITPERIIPPPPPSLVSAWDVFLTGIRDRMREFGESLPSIRESLQLNLGDALLGISDVFSNAVRSWDGTIGGFFKSVAQGFADMARQIIAELVRVMIYKALLKLFSGVAAGAAGGGDAGGGAGGHVDVGGGGHGSLAGLFGGGDAGRGLAFAGAGGSTITNTNSFTINVGGGGKGASSDMRTANMVAREVAMLMHKEQIRGK